MIYRKPRGRGSNPHKWQKCVSRFLFYLRPSIANSATIGTITVHCLWEAEMAREKAGHRSHSSLQFLLFLLFLWYWRSTVKFCLHVQVSILGWSVDPSNYFSCGLYSCVICNLELLMIGWLEHANDWLIAGQLQWRVVDAQRISWWSWDTTIIRSKFALFWRMMASEHLTTKPPVSIMYHNRTLSGLTLQYRPYSEGAGVGPFD